MLTRDAQFIIGDATHAHKDCWQLVCFLFRSHLPILFFCITAPTTCVSKQQIRATFLISPDKRQRDWKTMLELDRRDASRVKFRKVKDVEDLKRQSGAWPMQKEHCKHTFHNKMYWLFVPKCKSIVYIPKYIRSKIKAVCLFVFLRWRIYFMLIQETI